MSNRESWKTLSKRSKKKEIKETKNNEVQLRVSLNCISNWRKSISSWLRSTLA